MLGTPFLGVKPSVVRYTASQVHARVQLIPFQLRLVVLPERVIVVVMRIWVVHSNNGLADITQARRCSNLLVPPFPNHAPVARGLTVVALQAGPVS